MSCQQSSQVQLLYQKQGLYDKALECYEIQGDLYSSLLKDNNEDIINNSSSSIVLRNSV